MLRVKQMAEKLLQRYLRPQSDQETPSLRQVSLIKLFSVKQKQRERLSDGPNVTDLSARRRVRDRRGMQQNSEARGLIPALSVLLSPLSSCLPPQKCLNQYISLRF